MAPKITDYFNRGGTETDSGQLEARQPEVRPVGEAGRAVLVAMDQLLIAAEQAVEGSQHHDIAP